MADRGFDTDLVAPPEQIIQSAMRDELSELADEWIDALGDKSIRNADVRASIAAAGSKLKEVLERHSA